VLVKVHVQAVEEQAMRRPSLQVEQDVSMGQKTQVEVQVRMIQQQRQQRKATRCIPE